MDTLTQNLIKTVVAAMVSGTIPQITPQKQKQEAVEKLEEYYRVIIPACVDAVRKDTSLLGSSPVVGVDTPMEKLIKALVVASGEDDPDEIEMLTAYFNFMVPAHVNFIRQYPGIFQPITVSNPERIPDYVNAIVNAMTSNMFPPGMPANTNDIAGLSQYYTIQIAAYVLFVRSNPSIFSQVP